MIETIIPLCVSTIGARSLPVLKASIEAYAPNLSLYLHNHTDQRRSFGEHYNTLMQEAFELHDEVLIANDDIVLTPWSIEYLIADVEMLKRSTVKKLGLVAVRSDRVRPAQSIRNHDLPEHGIVEVENASPILAWISKEAFQAAQFPPINWFSDDILCMDLKAQGFRHFISRAYVHHVGSMTIGHGVEQLRAEAVHWLAQNRPELLEVFGLQVAPPTGA